MNESTNLEGIKSNLNQITKKSEEVWNTQNDFSYDRRGNLIRETNTKNGKVSV
ncbi:MAG: hypothetical protein K0R50_4253 [Eubacterium sp.]|nr:hypothetical protein [Eubacterium sp.]